MTRWHMTQRRRQWSIDYSTAYACSDILSNWREQERQKYYTWVQGRRHPHKIGTAKFFWALKSGTAKHMYGRTTFKISTAHFYI